MPGSANVRRVWLISPSIATILFFVAQLLLAVFGEPEKSSVTGAAANTPSSARQTRVVTQIRSIGETSRSTSRVPETEEALFDLLRRQPTVIFSSSEVEPLRTQSTQFGTDEVGIIKVTPRSH